MVLVGTRRNPVVQTASVGSCGVSWLLQGFSDRHQTVLVKHEAKKIARPRLALVIVLRLEQA